MTIFNIFTLAGGLAMFLYGMTTMGNGLEKLAGSKTASVLEKLTSSTLKGVLLGTIITALIQSSSGTTVIIIGLVNSGIMKFAQAVGVIMGANIGTTVTAQIIRLSDITGDNIVLKLLKPTSLAPIVSFIGIIFFMFSKNLRKRNIGQILLGFGILFFGMFTMEGSVAPLRESPLFAHFFTSLQNPILGILAGAMVTAVIQSSSASVGILQALTATGLVTWGSAIPIILGQNIGTCATGLIASTGASRAAKRVAFAHLYFNIVGSALFIAIIYGFKSIFGIEAWANTITKGDIANFHTLFNVASTLIFIPFVKLLVRIAEWTVPDKPGDTHPELELTILDQRLFTSPALAVSQARKAIEQMATAAKLNQQNCVDILIKYDEEKIQLALQRESIIDKQDVAVTNYLISLNDLDLSDTESLEVTTLLNYVTEFERIGDYADNIISRSGEVLDKEISFSEAAQKELYLLNGAVGEILQDTITAFTNNDYVAAYRIEPLEETIDLICESLRTRHIDRLKKGTCSIEAGVVFLEVLTDFERISDHCSNVAMRMIAIKQDADSIDPHALRRSMHEARETEYKNLSEHYKEKYYIPMNSIQYAD